MEKKQRYNGHNVWVTKFRYKEFSGEDGSWEAMWFKLLEKHKAMLDLSSIQLDGTHTPTKRGGRGC
jgi:hypothetical protein